MGTAGLACLACLVLRDGQSPNTLASLSAGEGLIGSGMKLCLWCVADRLGLWDLSVFGDLAYTDRSKFAISVSVIVAPTVLSPIFSASFR